MWEKKAAEAFVASITPMLRGAGYAPEIVGGVDYKGHSDHDLDVALHGLADADDFDWPMVHRTLTKLGWKNIPKPDQSIETYEHSDGRVVDFFFMGEA